MLEIIFIMLLTAMCCSIVGAFLVLRGMSMLSDAIAHAALLGIIVFYFIARDTQSNLLFFGAALSGVLTVIFIELFVQTKLVQEDASIGIVFPLFFSIAVILVARYASRVHIDTECILMGNVIWAPLNRSNLFGLNLPQAVWQMGFLLIISLLLLALFYKEMKLISFDPTYACVTGFTVILLHYGLMTLTSFVSVYAFENVGAILVISFMITPPATAYFISKRLWQMIFYSLFFSGLSSILGVVVAYRYDLSISGTASVFSGLIFVVVALFNQNGIISKAITKYRNQKKLTAHVILMSIADGLSLEEAISTMNKNEQAKITEELLNFGWLNYEKDKKTYIMTAKGNEVYNSLISKPVR